jgi:hypothetical protein
VPITATIAFLNVILYNRFDNNKHKLGTFMNPVTQQSVDKIYYTFDAKSDLQKVESKPKGQRAIDILTQIHSHVKAGKYANIVAINDAVQTILKGYTEAYDRDCCQARKCWDNFCTFVGCRDWTEIGKVEALARRIGTYASNCQSDVIANNCRGQTSNAANPLPKANNAAPAGDDANSAEEPIELPLNDAVKSVASSVLDSARSTNASTATTATSLPKANNAAPAGDDVNSAEEQVDLPLNHAVESVASSAETETSLNRLKDEVLQTLDAALNFVKGSTLPVSGNQANLWKKAVEETQANPNGSKIHVPRTVVVRTIPKILPDLLVQLFDLPSSSERDAALVRISEKVAALTTTSELRGDLNPFAFKCLLEKMLLLNYADESTRGQVARHCLSALNNRVAIETYAEKVAHAEADWKRRQFRDAAMGKQDSVSEPTLPDVPPLKDPAIFDNLSLSDATGLIIRKVLLSYYSKRTISNWTFIAKKLLKYTDDEELKGVFTWVDKMKALLNKGGEEALKAATEEDKKPGDDGLRFALLALNKSDAQRLHFLLPMYR